MQEKNSLEKGKKWKDYNIPHFDSWDITSRCYMSAADARYPGN